MRLLCAAAILFLSSSGAPGETGLWILPLAPTVWPPLTALLLQWPPSPLRTLRGTDIVQWSGVSWGRRLPPFIGTCHEGGAPPSAHAFQNIQRNSPCRLYANPERSLQKRSQKWLHGVGSGASALGVQETTTCSSESPSLPPNLEALMWGQAPSPWDTHLSQRAPHSTLWPAALPVCQTAQMCFNPDREHSQGQSGPRLHPFSLVPAQMRK